MMRWHEPVGGEERTRTGFLWRPRRAFCGDVRWLERATIRERFLCGTYFGFWSTVCFVDEEAE